MPRFAQVGVDPAGGARRVQNGTAASTATTIRNKQHVFIYIANPTSASLYFNTNLVNPKDFKSFWDLVQPKWKGKFVSQEPTSTGIGPSLQFFFYHPDLGPEFLRKLFIDQQPVFHGRDRRQITDWLAQGKFALCLGCRDSDRAKKQGLPVDDHGHGRLEGRLAISLPGGGSMSLIKGGPHPNAAKVFINWFLSRRGPDRAAKVRRSLRARAAQLPARRYPKGRCCRRAAGWSRGGAISILQIRNTPDMTPIYQVAKEFMKGREEK